MSTQLMKYLALEDKNFQDMMRKSGALGEAGIYMVAFLLSRPSYWKYFPLTFKKRLLNKKYKNI